MSVDEHPEFIILIAFISADSTRYSELYFGLQCLDFQLHKLENRIIFMDMRRLNYTLSWRKGSKNDLKRQLSTEGGPDECGWKIENLELRLNDHEGEQRLSFF